MTALALVAAVALVAAALAVAPTSLRAQRPATAPAALDARVTAFLAHAPGRGET